MLRNITFSFVLRDRHLHSTATAIANEAKDFTITVNAPLTLQFYTIDWQRRQAEPVTQSLYVYFGTYRIYMYAPLSSGARKVNIWKNALMFAICNLCIQTAVLFTWALAFWRKSNTIRSLFSRLKNPGLEVINLE